MESLSLDPTPLLPRAISPDDVARRIVRRADAIGPSPSLLRLEERLRHGDTSARQLGRLIEGSPALAARVLRLANSAYYAPPDPLVSLSRAVVLIGDAVIQQLVLTSLITSRRATARTPRQALAVARVMGDAVRSAVICRAVASATRLAAPDDAFVAGLLHDLGHIYLLDDDDDRYAGYLIECIGRTDDPVQELVLTGTTHARVGAAFANAWHLPPMIAEVLLHHHDPEPHTLAAIVRASDWLVRELNATNSQDPAVVSERVDASLAAIGLERSVWDGMVPSVRDGYAGLLTLFDEGEGRAV